METVVNDARAPIVCPIPRETTTLLPNASIIGLDTPSRGSGASLDGLGEARATFMTLARPELMTVA